MTETRSKTRSSAHGWRSRLSALLRGMPESSRQRRWRLIARLAQVSRQDALASRETSVDGRRAADDMRRT
jgi:hypothetical protein